MEWGRLYGKVCKIENKRLERNVKGEAFVIDNYKRVIAGILTAIMVMTVNGMPDVKASSGGGGGTGGLAGLVTDVFSVVVPTQPDMSVDENKIYTNSPLNFILDPKRITPPAAPDMTFEDNARIFFRNHEAGAPYDYSSTSDGFTIINKSTTKVDVTLKASLTGMDGVKLTNDRTFTDDKSASVYLALIDSKNKVAAVDKFGAVMKTTLEGKPEAYNVTYNASTGKYKNEMKSDSEIAAEGITFENYTFRMTGNCNEANSWSNLSDTIEPTFTITWLVALRPKNVAPSIPKDFYVMNEGNPLSIGVDLGSGALGANGIKEITFVNSNGVTKTVSTNNYVLNKDDLVFTASYINQLISEGIRSRSFVVTFNDNVETKKKITLVTNDVAPSIGLSEYTITKGQSVEVDVDLGSGALGATGIKSITFVPPTGGTKTLSTDNYTFADSVLTFKASLIDMMLSNGVVSREFTITFNDRAGTQIAVMMNANGIEPSIAQTEYIMEKGKDVEVTVDLGSETLAATGIKSITFAPSAGETKTLLTDKYTFANSVLTFKADLIDMMFSNGVVSRTFTIYFNNVTSTPVKITLTAQDMIPSNTDAEYPMMKGQPVTVDVDLGLGTLGATGIKSITFVSPTGETKTLLTDKYTFANGVLTFNAGLIDMMFSNGIVLREFTVTLNDKAGTRFAVTLKANGVEPSVAQTEYMMETGKDVSVNVDLGSDALAATGIKSITFVAPTGETKTLLTDKYTLANNVLTFKASLIDMMLSNGVLSRTFTITFNNVTSTSIKTTLKVDGKSPSIAQTEYTMEKGKDVPVNVDLGSKTLEATGISSITFVPPTGGTKTLLTDKYTFVNSTLTFKASLIDMMLNNSVDSRTFTITFNDVAKTQTKVTLKALSVAPSINITEYKMVSGQVLPIDIDLGSGEAKATGIKSITYKEGGKDVVVSSSYYFLDNGILKLRASYINGILSAKVTSREYIITFNDKTQTSGTIILKK